MVRKSTPYGFFASRLAAPVGIDWTWRISLQIGAVFAAVENIIGRNVQESQARTGTSLSKHGRTGFVAQARIPDCALSKINLCIRRRVYHDARRVAGDSCRDRSSIGDISFRMCQSTQRPPPRGGDARELLTELPVAAEDEDHAGTPNRSPL